MGLLGKKKDKFKKAAISEMNSDDELDSMIISEDNEDDLPEAIKRIQNATQNTQQKPMTPQQINKAEDFLMAKVAELEKKIQEIGSKEVQETRPVEERVRILREHLIHPVTGEILREFFDDKTGIKWSFLTDLEYLTQLANRK